MSGYGWHTLRLLVLESRRWCEILSSDVRLQQVAQSVSDAAILAYKPQRKARFPKSSHPMYEWRAIF